MNNNKYHTAEYKEKQDKARDLRLGRVKEHNKKCVKCNNEYIIEGREHTKKVQDSKYCSRSCANSRQDYWNNNATNYRTLCFQNNPKECRICGFDKIVVVHHMDEDHNNNDIENLIPLCPNHHEMFHSKHKEEVLKDLNSIMNRFKEMA
tara:strand:+ start:85 stop:531 length:447 start_codon:yes stop_codon:yes gene_type:complete